ncbi:MAG: hypothetical protein ACYC8T_15540 [Myxococcaceae bacterium]
MTTKQPGPRRVEAWIYGVINPLEEALEREALDGRRRVPSYRWRSDSLENLLPLRQYLSRSAAVILDDLATYHPPIIEMEEDHDTFLSELRRRAKQVFEELVANQAFRTFVEQNFRKVCDPKSMVNDVAEDLVNDDPEFVDVNEGSYREVWNRTLGDLKKLRGQAAYEPLRTALVELETRSDEMRQELLQLRAQLAEDFDVPPAPLHP